MNSPVFGSAEATLHLALNVIDSIAPTTLTALFLNDFSSLQTAGATSDLKLPAFFLPENPEVVNNEVTLPFIYVAGLVGEKGELPTLEQLEHTVGRMKEYATIYLTEPEWIIPDLNATNIDTHKGYKVGGWDWSVESKNECTTYKENDVIAHSRRYVCNENDSKNILKFVSKMSERLVELRYHGMKGTDAIPWSILDVGYTSQLEQFKKKYYSNSSGGNVVKG